MRKKASRRSFGSQFALVGAFAALTMVGAEVRAAELPGAQINECNSDITIGVSPMMPIQGQTASVTLTVASVDSRDNMNNAVAQEFAMALFTGDCQQPPGVPCAPSMPAGVMYQGNVGGTCPGVVPVPMGNGLVEFDFVPDLSLTVTGAAPPYTPASCTITFDVLYTVPGAYAVQANTSGECQNPGFPPGSVTSDTTVTSVVTVVSSCGDGILDPGEECDDGNNVDGDGCSAMCTLEPFCGDGTLDPGEECDDGNNVDGDGCSAMCTVEPFCGDGTLDPGEECDDGNNVDGDGCSAMCTIEPFCGDGTLDPGEECDDGNNVDGDGCSAMCTIEPSCGDGTLDPGEECDDGNNVDGDGCSAMCTVEPSCGDGTLDPGEECDDGNNVDGDGCSAMCTVEPSCGDGTLDPGEECDDGNNVDGDGCSSACVREVPTLPEWALIFMALSLLGIGFLAIRGRSHPA